MFEKVTKNKKQILAGLGVVLLVFVFGYLIIRAADPNNPTSLAQYKADGVTPISNEAWTDENQVKLYATSTDETDGEAVAMYYEFIGDGDVFTSSTAKPTGACDSGTAYGDCVSKIWTNASSSGISNWYDSSWDYRRKITIDASLVMSTESDFVVLVATSTDSKVAANAREDGYDIIFTDSTGTSTISAEREYYSSTTGEMSYWVKLPDISSTTNTEIYMYYGNAGSSDMSTTTGVWDSNYAMVQHLQESDIDGGAGDIKDSTVNANNATSSGMDTGDQVAGKINGGFDFDGVNDYLDVSSITNSSAATVGLWFKYDTAGPSEGLVSNGNATTTATTIAFMASSSASSNGDAGSLEVSMPTGTSEGDLLLAVFSKDDDLGTFSSPNGWTDIAQFPIDADARVLFSYRIATSGESGPYTFLSSDSDDLAIGIARYSGVDTSNPINCFSTSTDTGTAVTAPACTTDVANTMVVRAMGADDDDYTPGANYPSAHSGRFTVPSTGNQQTHCALADVAQVAIGTTGSADFTMSAAEEWGSLTVALKPGTTGGVNGAVHFKVNNNLLTASPNGGTDVTYTVSSGTWYHAAYTFQNSGNIILYVNGDAVDTDSPGANDWNGTNIKIGHENADYSSGVRFFDGIIDEVRISDSVRSATWIKTEYNNINSSSTFLTFDSEVSPAVVITDESISIPGLPDSSTGYKWQALACDTADECSSWVVFNATTPNFKVDATAPTTPGNLTEYSVSLDSVTLIFGATTTDPGFVQYKIFYKEGSSGVDEGDTLHGSSTDGNLGDVDFNNATTTQITGLASSTQYVINIWAYDIFGRKASATEMTIITGSEVLNPSGLVQYKADDITSISNEAWTDENQINLYSTSTGSNVNLYYQLVDNGTALETSTSAPSSPCADGASYGSCTNKIWKKEILAATWYNDSFDYRFKVTIDGTKVPSAQTDFPVYLDAGQVGGAHNFWDNVQGDGGDIVITEDDGTTRLPVEIVDIATTSNTGEVHFKADLTGGSDTFYVYYGSSTASQPAASDPYGSEAVWSNYISAWHMEEDPTGSPNDIIDSGSNSAHGDSVGTMAAASAAQIGNGYTFDGSADYINIDDIASLYSTNDNTVFTTWYKTSETVNDLYIFTCGTSTDDSGELRIYPAGEALGDSDGEDGIAIAKGRGAWEWTASYGSGFSDGAWHLLHVFIDGTGNRTVYVDNTLLSPTVEKTVLPDWDSIVTVVLGQEWDAGAVPSDLYNGSLDEMRMSTSSLSADWVETEYNNQKYASTFYSIDDAIEFNMNITGLPDSSDGYKWQALACDISDYCSSWTVFNVTTPNFKVDANAPTTPGNLTESSVSLESITLTLGATTTDVGFVQYKIFYKEGSSGVDEGDTLHGSSTDVNLGDVDYDDAVTTQITGLSSSTQYVINIWAYDVFGRKASATEMTITTKSKLNDPGSLAQYKADGTTSIVNGAWHNENQVNLYATSTAAGDTFLYYELIGSSTSFSTSTAQPASTCSSGTAYGSCSSKIWTNETERGDWYDSNWLYRKKITIDADKVVDDESSFPVLISTSTDSHVVARARSDGYDIIFTDSTGISALQFEREYYNSSTGQLVAWVEMDISSTTDTDIYMYYGNSGQSTDLATTTGIWDINYQAVYHLNEDGTSTSGGYGDSTANDDDATGISMTSDSDVGGKIYRAQNFDGDADYLDFPTYFTAGGSEVTISMWVDPNENVSTNAYYNAYSGEYWQFTVREDTFMTRDASGGWQESRDNDLSWPDPDYTTGWHYLVIRYSVSEGIKHIYTDGAEVASTTAGVGALTSERSAEHMVAPIIGVGDGTYYDGQMDEVRISNTARSFSSIATEYNNQSDPATFMSFDSSEYRDTGSDIKINVTSIDDSSTGYKWQVLDCDADGDCSDWVVFNATAPNFKVDTQAPTAPGDLTVLATTSDSIKLGFGASTTEDNFTQYKIFYKAGTGVVLESDTLYGSSSDSNLGYQDYNNKSSTTIDSLSASTTYSFVIFAYDELGNKASSSVTEARTNAIPTSTINSIAQRTDGTGRLDISLEVDDGNDDDTVKAKVEYVAGTTCNFASPLDPTLDETDGNTTADNGDPKIDDNETYQIGTSTGWILTSGGSNTVLFDWVTKIDLDDADGNYCMRVTANDGRENQSPVATSTFYIDNKDPLDLGNLTEDGKSSSSVTLIFGTQATETNFSEYKIFYKEGSSGVTEGDSLHGSSTDANLGEQDFDTATTTTITGLNSGTQYVFNIWAYDDYGNKASATEMTVITYYPPTGEINSAAQRTDGTGRLDISIEVDDGDNDDTVMARIEYATGTDCDFSIPGDPTLDEASFNIDEDYGDVRIENDNEYQVGKEGNWIQTSPGSNTVLFDWLTNMDLASADGDYCIRLTVNDGSFDQDTPATTTVTIDNVKPVGLGSLTEDSKASTSVILTFGSDVTETNFSEYKIFYKAGSSGVTESDSMHGSSTDSNLASSTYGSAATTTISGLDPGTEYVFNIWAYDDYGNKASATEMTITTKYLPTSPTGVAQYKADAVTAIDNGAWTTEDEVNLSATSTEGDGVNAIKLYYHLIASSSTFNSSTTEPADPCASGSNYNDCTDKIWIASTSPANIKEIDDSAIGYKWQVKACDVDGCSSWVVFNATLPNFKVDNTAPTAPGDLSIESTLIAQVTLGFGASTTEDNFSEYKIYYKIGTGTISEANSLHGSSTDSNLSNQDYGEATTTIIEGLEHSTLYSFAIFAYDQAGNVSSSSVATTTTASPPSNMFVSVIEKADGSGDIDVVIYVNDDEDDDLKVKIEYVSGESCDFSSPNQATIDETDAKTTADDGDPKVDGNEDYQIGTSTGWIETDAGANTVYFDWNSATDLPNANGEVYCLRMTVNDITSDTASDTATTTIDNKAPVINAVYITNGTYKIGDEIDIIINADATGYTLGTSTANGKTVTDFTDNGDNSYQVTYSVVEGDTDRDSGDIPISIMLVDSNNNANSAYTTPETNTASVDANKPNVTAIYLTDLAYGVGDTIRATTTVTSDSDTYTLGATTINNVTATNLQKINDTTYTFDYLVVEGNTNRDPGDIPASLILIDSVGQYNDPAYDTVETNTASIDANSPGISNVTFYPSSGVLGIGDTATATIYATGNETGLASSTTMTINGVDVSDTFIEVGGGQYTVSYTATEGDNDILDSENLPIVFKLKDATGNESDSYTASDISGRPGVDANKPTISSVSFEPTSGILKIGDIATATITVVGSETGLSSSTTMTINGVDVSDTFAEKGSGQYTVTYTVAAGNTDRLDSEDLPVNLKVSDDGSNDSDAYTTADINNRPGVDGNRPTITNVTFVPTSGVLKIGEIATATITVGGAEAGLSTGTTMTINSVDVSDTFVASGTGQYTVVYTVVEGNNDISDDEDLPVSLQVQDPAGNDSLAYTTQATTTRPGVDANKPVISNVVFEPTSGILGIGDIATATIYASGEAGLSTGTTMTINSVDVEATFLVKSPGQYWVTYTVSQGDNEIADDEDLPVNFSLIDPAGNESVAYITADIDNRPGVDSNKPTISSVSFEPTSGVLGIDDIATATITVGDSETGLSAGTTMTINDVDVSGTFLEVGGGQYTVIYTVVSGNNDISDDVNLPVDLQVADGGNDSDAFTAEATTTRPGVDANRPTITNVTFMPTSGLLGIGSIATATITVGGSETGLSAGTTMTINDVDVSSTFLEVGGGQYTVTYTVTEGDTDRADDEDLPVSLQIQDAASNDSTAYTTADSGNRPGVDATEPVAPGNLTYYSNTNTSIILTFGSQSSDTNFSEYKIYYKVGSSGVTESGTMHGSSTDANLASSTYAGATSTTITGLATSTQYVFNIWAYDDAGNASSAVSEITVWTNRGPDNPAALVQYKNDKTTVIPNGSWIDETEVVLKATSSLNGGDSETLDLYYQFIDNDLSFRTSTKVPTSSCADGTAYTSCTDKLWKKSLGSGASWYNASWDYRLKITVDGTEVPAAQTDFPMYLDLSRISGSHDFWDNVKSGGEDMIITESDGTTRLALEVVSIATTSNIGEVHFKADISGGNDVFYVYYGNSAASQPATTTTYGRNAVWSNDYVAVYHMSETSGHIIDSVGAHDSATIDVDEQGSATGKIGGACDFEESSSHYIDITEHDDFDLTSAVTVEAWIKPEDVPMSWAKIVTKGMPTNDDPFAMYSLMLEGATPQHISAEVGPGPFPGDNEDCYGTTPISGGVWIHGAVTYDASDLKVFSNGDWEKTTSDLPGNMNINDTGLRIGGAVYAGEKFDGIIDEVRISSIDRTSTWILTGYNNATSSTTFYSSVSDEEESPFVNIPSISESPPYYKWQVLACNNNNICSSWTPYNVSTPNLKIDITPPTAPGDLTINSKNSTTITLNFGATSTESNFSQYKIFYTTGVGEPTEADTLHGSSTDDSLGDILYNGATTTLIQNLSASTTYSFIIYAYDLAGNKASSSYVSTTTGSGGNPPTGLFNSAGQKTDGSGAVDISIEVDDPDNDDAKAQLEYATGTDCNFSPSGDPTLDETPANISADSGTIVIDNNETYQIGSTSYWILTATSNTVQFDWSSATDLPTGDGDYCLRLTVNDGDLDQTIPATTTLTIDNVDPSTPGNLTYNSELGDSIILNFGATSTDTNFSRYRIYYKLGSSGVSESDTEHSDGNLTDQDFNEAATTSISNLTPGATYVFNIWAYDDYGNKTSATEYSVTLNEMPYDPSGLLQKRENGNNITNGEIIDVSNVNLIASSSDSATGILTFYFNMATSSGTFITATSTPSSTCSSGTNYSSCSSKVWSVATTTTAQGDWYSVSWSYRKKITILSSQVMSTESNFPVLVSSTDSDLISNAREDAYDIIFTDSTGTSTIQFEREYFSSSTGEMYYWVKADISSTTDTDIYMYYGNSDQSTDMATTTGVWDSNYVMVHHLEEDSGTVTDSTGNYDGTYSGAAQNYDGPIDGADDFDGAGDYISLGTDCIISGNTWTFEGWINENNAASYDRLFTQGSGACGPRQIMIFWLASPSYNNALYVRSADDGLDGDPERATASLNPDTWYHFVWTRNNGSNILYINGQTSSSATSSIAMTVDGNNYIAARIGSSNNYWDGPLDEIRLSDSVRSATWIETEYNNQNNPSTFFNFFSEEESGLFIAETVNIPSISDSASSSGYKWQVMACDSDDGCSNWTAFNASVPNFEVDTSAPAGLGSLTIDGQTTDTIILDFGSAATDTHFDQYKIYYKLGSSGVTESDTLFGSSSDANLASSTYGGAATTTIPDLLDGAQYVFNIFAYDDLGHMASATEVSGYTNFAPTSSFVSAVQGDDGTGRVDISIIAYDGNSDDLKAKLEYATGTSCSFSSPGDPTLDETDYTATSTYDDAKIENTNTYQIGNSSGWITTDSGTNTINFDWLSSIDIPTADDTYCLRITSNDGVDDQIIQATTTLTIDNIDPTAPGNLTLNSDTSNSITLAFGATTTETNFKEYKIFYKQGVGSVTESDTEHDDPDLDDIDFNDTTTTTISGLIQGAQYSFKIWAYDDYGHKAASGQVTFTTNFKPTGSINSASQKIDGTGIVDISIEVYDTNGDTTKAKIEYVAGAACDFSSPQDPTIDITDGNTTADNGDPKVDDNETYQIGTSTGWILTSGGSNTVNFDWLSDTDLPAGDGTYCIRLTVNDGDSDQATPATTTLTIDNVAPTVPGDLTVAKVDGDDVILAFGATSTEINFTEYKIFYKQDTSGVTENDTEYNRYDDTDLGDIDYGDTATTVITSLAQLTDYVFNIWVYDDYGNKASGTNSVSTTTQSIPQATWREAEDIVDPTVGTYLGKEENVRVRIAVSNTGDWESDESRYKIQFGEKDTACSDLAVWDDVPTTSVSQHWEMVSSSYFVDQEASVARLANTESYSWVDGSLIEYPSNLAASTTLSVDEYTEVEYAFQATTDATAGQTYCFRLLQNGEILDAYSQYPELTLAPKPQGSFVSAAQKTDGSHVVDISTDISDINGDLSKAKIEYVAGATCDFSSPEDPTLDETDENITATYGDPDIDDGEAYQVGSTTGNMIITTYGTNTVEFDWTTDSDLTGADGTYCLRLTANDGYDDSTPATTTLTIDQKKPTNPGNLTEASKTTNSITLAFGSASSDTNFKEYKIFYKEGSSGVTEGDTEWNSTDDPNLASSTYSGATSTTIIDNLEINKQYVFRIWAYDDYGHKASSSGEIVVDIWSEKNSGGSWRWFYDQFNETPVSAVAAENVTPNDISAGNVLKLRMAFLETEGLTAENSKIRLQYSVNSDFSADVYWVGEIGSTSIWIYGDGVDEDDDTITTLLLTTSTQAMTHNESGISTSTADHQANTWAEWEFTVRNNGAATGTTYYFRGYDNNISEAIALASGYSYPSIITAAGSLTFTVSGLSSGISTEGVVTDATTTNTSVPFGILSADVEVVGAQRFTIDTNMGGGYQLFVYQRSGLISGGGGTINSVSAANESPAAWPTTPDPSNFGYHTGDSTLSGASPSRFSAPNTYAKFETTMKEVGYSPIPVDNEEFDLIFRTEVSTAQEAGDYSTDIVYILVPVF